MKNINIVSKNLLFIILIIILFVSIFFILKNGISINIIEINECTLIDPIKINARVQEIEKNKSSYSSSSIVILGLSTEGEVKNVYRDNRDTVLINITAYRETGNTNINYFIKNGIIYYISSKNTQYTMPFTEPDFNFIDSTIVYDEYYPSENRLLCTWSRNGEIKAIDENSIKDLKNLFKNLLN